MGGEGHCRIEAEGLSSSPSARTPNRFGRLRGLGRFLRGITVVVIDGVLGNVGCRSATGEEAGLF